MVKAPSACSRDKGWMVLHWFQICNNSLSGRGFGGHALSQDHVHHLPGSPVTTAIICRWTVCSWWRSYTFSSDWVMALYSYYSHRTQRMDCTTAFIHQTRNERSTSSPSCSLFQPHKFSNRCPVLSVSLATQIKAPASSIARHSFRSLQRILLEGRLQKLSDQNLSLTTEKVCPV